ncbi:MAG: ROK family transcriptional regulator [Dermatophilaceae bacterium]
MPRVAATTEHRVLPRGGDPGSAGHVLDLIRRAGGLTRAEILELTGLARSTVTSRLATLHSAGLVTTADAPAPGRGRPPSQFRFVNDSGVLLLADAGATGVRTAITDLDGTIHHEITVALDITIGPDAWLTEVSARFAQLLRKEQVGAALVRGIGLAVPGPVDFASGTVVQPPIMTGWNGFPIRAWFADTYAGPVIVDNDANAMATGEYAAAHTDRSSMVMLKVATGIGAGIIVDRHLHRGEDGAAGDIGHIQLGHLADDEVPQCRCGNYGCVEAYAAGWALVRDLQAQGREVDSVRDLVDLVRHGDPVAVSLTRDAGRTIGIALADAVSLLNPAVVVVGGELGDAAPNLVAGIRETIYARSLPLATRRLEVLPAALGHTAGLHGLARTLTDHVFDPARIDAQLGA